MGNIEENKLIIRLPIKSLIVILIFTVSFFSLMVYLLYLGKLLFSLVMLLGLLISVTQIVSWFRWKITVKGNQITSSSWLWFGRKKEYTFDYITEVKCGEAATVTGKHHEYMQIWHEKENLCYITAFFPGYYVLRSLLEKKGVSFVDTRVDK